MSVNLELNKEKTTNTEEYIVWIDSIPNHFDNLLDAEIEKIEWIEKGYDNIVIEKVK